MGPRRSGKTSIDRVIFQNMSPHETLFLEATTVCDINKTLSNRLTQFQTWDFGGDVNLMADIDYMNQSISFETIFKKSNTLVYVIDAQEDDYEHALPKLAETISVAHNANPNMNFEVFLHKVDGDFMSEDNKAERKQVRPLPLSSPPLIRSQPLCSPFSL
jgi:Ras-related GTP-binding protein C/D